MKFNFKFSNLLGTVYRKGNLTFTSDGNSVVSPVGNRITILDLNNNKSETLPVEASYNITAIALAPDGNLMIAVSEDGEALLISLVSRTLIHRYHFHRTVHAICFSPDGQKFAVTKENTVLLFHAPGRTRDFNPFVLQRTFYGAYDENVSIDWTTDSRAFCVGSRDMNARVYGAERFRNLIVYSIGGHTDSIVNAFFEEHSLDVYSVSENGMVSVWECNTELEDLVPWRDVAEDQESSDEDGAGEEDADHKAKKESEAREAAAQKDSKLLYKRLDRYNFKSARGEDSTIPVLTTAAFHKRTHILVTGFQDGAFFLHEMPNFNLIHSLSISEQSVTSLAFSPSGEWIALGCSGLGQLLVWEWQSESYVLKQQGHFNNMSCLAYSPDGQYIVTGGDDGKVKLWNTDSGFCFVTFSEHLAGITAVTFNQGGQVVLSCSLDGTVRAFDLNRYRNFRTFTSPRPTQFSCLAVDPSGEVVCAGAMDHFEIYVWSMQTGRLLDILAGHGGPISSVTFSPTRPLLASGSWDKTVRIWDVFESRGSKEVLSVASDVLAIAFRPDGNQIAVASLNAQISFWDPETGVQSGAIEGRHDLGYSKKDTDKVTARTSSKGKAFNTLCYTADGQCVLAAGRSKNVCIYSVPDQMLIKKFEITCNLSLDGTQEMLDRRKMTEWGNLALVDQGEGEDGQGAQVSLPGVKKGDLSSRHWKPEVRVSGVQFSPTGRAWSATTTEGLLVYSLDQRLVFDPFLLDVDVTPANVKLRLADGEYSTALMMALRLNEMPLTQHVVESTPVTHIDLVGSALPAVYLDKALHFLAGQLETSPHIHFYLEWCQRLLASHGPQLKQRSQRLMATLRTMQKNLTRRHDDLSKICDHNKYSMQYLVSLGHLKRKQNSSEAAKEEESADEADESESESEQLIDCAAGDS